MSRAFIKEDSGEGLEDLPDRPISPHSNFVTKRGFDQIEQELLRLNQAYAAAQAQGDRILLQRTARDLRYWSQRRLSAQILSEPIDKNHIQFGSSVRLEGQNGKSVVYRIVGEDEADPAKGTLSYVSPLANALMGKQKGDSVRIGSNIFEIEDIL